MNNILKHDSECYCIIVWKMIDNIFKCHLSNIGIKKKTSLTDYLQTINHADYYNKLIRTKERQTIIFDNKKIILQYVNSKTITETSCPNDNNMNLISCISHKIRNPLTNIIGILSLSDDNDVDHISKKYMNILKRSSFDIVGAVNDLIDILNLYNNELKLSYDKINLDKLLIECQKIALDSLNDKSKSISVKINNIPDIIITDIRRLQQVIINSLINAIQHTSVNDIYLTVSLYTENLHTQLRSPHKYINTEVPIYNIVFTIENVGHAIDTVTKNYLDYVLQLNHDTDCQSKKIRGFGLLINRHLCSLLKGNVWYYSTDKTITFCFNILCNGIVLDDI